MNLKKLKKAELIEQIEKLNRKIGFLEEELQETRIRMKYALFDSEATERENNALRKMLDDRDKDTS